METRTRKGKQTVSYADEDDSSDEGKKHRRSRRKLNDNFDYSDKKARGGSFRKSRSSIPPLRVSQLKTMSDIDKSKLTTDPSGSHECRFVPFEDIGENILRLDEYMKPEERGILTFLPKWIPGEPDVLAYFGFKKDLARTELKDIARMNTDELEKELEELELELSTLPKPEKTSTVVIPGFSIGLQTSIPIRADVTDFDWSRLGRTQHFDVILMDPPWHLALQSCVTRGVKLPYNQLDVQQIAKMPIREIQKNGYIFMWVIASQIVGGAHILKQWGYEIVEYINWVKISKYGRYMPSHGYYMQHDKETLLIGRKGKEPLDMVHEYFDSLIIKQRDLRQSHKPEVLYEMIEKMFPDSMYLEIFARPHNLRDGWVSMGIELPS